MENIDKISTHHFFIYKDKKLVGYTPDPSELKLYIKHRQKILPPEIFQKYEVVHMIIDDDTTMETIQTLSKYENEENKYTLVMGEGTNTFFISKDDEAVMVEYDTEYVYGLEDAYMELLKMMKLLKLTRYENEKYQKFKECMDQLIKDVYHSDDELEENIFDQFGLFSVLLKLQIIS